MAEIPLKRNLKKAPFLADSKMFGVGWVITGACAFIALAQLGEVRIASVITIFGIISGVWVYRTLLAATFRLDTGVCEEEQLTILGGSPYPDLKLLIS